MASPEGNEGGIVMRAAGAGAGTASRTPPASGGKRIEVPIKKAGGGVEEKLHTWPFLVRNEFLMSLLVIIVLTVWSLLLNAPLEQPSNPTRTPNPSKAPWYFLGLQEMLVFFDPWYAGVVLPSFIIVGLMLIPYLDINPKGNGYYTLRERFFEITGISSSASTFCGSRSSSSARFSAAPAGTGSGPGRSGIRTWSRR